MPEQGKGEAEQLRKIFIGGLNYNTKDESLKEFYEQWGSVVDYVVMKDPKTRRSRGFGFITYSEAYMVDDAMANRPHVIDDRQVEPKRAVPRDLCGKVEVGNVRKLFIGGLGRNVEKEDLEDYFGQYGKLTDCAVVLTKDTGEKRGFGFVEYEDVDSADKVVLMKDHEVKGRRVDVKKAIAREDIRGSERSGSRGGGGGGRDRDRGDDRSRDRGGRGGRDDYRGNNDGWNSNGSSNWGGSGGGGGGNYNNPWGNNTTGNWGGNMGGGMGAGGMGAGGMGGGAWNTPWAGQGGFPNQGFGNMGMGGMNPMMGMGNMAAMGAGANPAGFGGGGFNAGGGGFNNQPAGNVGGGGGGGYNTGGYNSGGGSGGGGYSSGGTGSSGGGGPMRSNYSSGNRSAPYNTSGGGGYGGRGDGSGSGGRYN